MMMMDKTWLMPCQLLLYYDNNIYTHMKNYCHCSELTNFVLECLPFARLFDEENCELFYWFFYTSKIMMYIWHFINWILNINLFLLDCLLFLGSSCVLNWNLWFFVDIFVDFRRNTYQYVVSCERQLKNEMSIFCLLRRCINALDVVDSNKSRMLIILSIYWDVFCFFIEN